MAVKGGSLHEPKQLPHQYSSPFVRVEMNGRFGETMRPDRFERLGVGGVSGLIGASPCEVASAR